MNGHGGNGKKRATKRRRTVLSPPTKAQLAARDRFLREAEQTTGIKVTPEDVAAIVAELEALQ